MPQFVQVERRRITSIACMVYLLEWFAHNEDRPIAKACEGHDHISPEEKNIGSLREFQISQDHEKCSLQEEKQCHFNMISGKGHQPDSQGEKAKDSKHPCHDYILLSYVRT